MPFIITYPNQHEPTTWGDGTRRPADDQPWPKSPRPAPVYTRVDGYVEIPAFSYNMVSGFQQICPSNVPTRIAQFNYSVAERFSFRQFHLVNMNENSDQGNFILCVKFRTGNVVTRYILWHFFQITFGKQLFEPVYNGEVIERNFSLEVWFNVFTFPPTGVYTLLNQHIKQMLLSLSYAPTANGDTTPRKSSEIISSNDIITNNTWNTAGFAIPIPFDPNIAFIAN